jgi:MYXO-CTERM domain-containing protein
MVGQTLGNRGWIVAVGITLSAVPAAAAELQLRPPGTMGAGLQARGELSAPLDPQAATTCAAGTTLPGIDVSTYQGNIDWDAVANAGIVYAIVRVSHGVNTLDDQFDDNWAQARAAGVHTGVYQYFEPGQDPIQQADILIDRMGPLGPDDLPPVIDVEATSGLGPAAVATSVGQWIDHVEAAIGIKPIIYTGRYFWQDNVGSSDFAEYPLWIAHYTDGCPNIPDQWGNWVFHQYTSSGSVAGISGAVDRDNFNGDLAALLAYGGGPAECGDAKCNGDETPDSCIGDCPPCGVIDALGSTIDDGDACYALRGPQEYWRHETSGEAGDLAWTMVTADASASNYAEVALHFAEAGHYRVEANVVTGFGSSKLASYAVTHGSGTADVPVDQSSASGWVSLGEFDFAAGSHEQSIYTGDNTGESVDAQLRLCLDAFRITRLDVPASDESSDDGGSSDERGDDESSAGDDGTEGPLDPDSGSDDDDTNALPPGFADGADANGCGCHSGGSDGVRLLWLALLAAPLRRRRPRH